MPYIYLYDTLDEDGKAKLLSLHSKKLTEEQKVWIRKVMEETGVLKKAYTYAKKLGDEAVTLMKSEGEDALADIVTAMIERDF